MQHGERVYGRAVAHRITIAEHRMYVWFIIHMRGANAAREKYLRFLFVFSESGELLTSFFLFLCCHNSHNASLLSTQPTLALRTHELLAGAVKCERRIGFCMPANLV